MIILCNRGEASEGEGMEHITMQHHEQRTLGPRRSWEDNIKMYLRKVEWEAVDWIHLAQERDQWRAVVNTVMNLRFP